MRIDLALDLEVIPYHDPDPVDEFLLSFTDRRSDWRAKTRTQSTFVDRADVVGAVVHRNYLAYLEHCWARHLGVVLTPDVLWYTLLCEVTGIVGADPEKYRALFTARAEGKTAIAVFGVPGELPLGRIATELEQLVPGRRAETYLPGFSTTDAAARLAQRAAFADLVSPYYSYMVFACGLRSVRVEGTADDWTRLEGAWAAVAADFPDEAAYFNRVGTIVSTVAGEVTSGAMTPSFWSDMFRAERCGSGSQTEVFGWWTDLYRVQPDGVRTACNFATHVARVPWRDLTTETDYVLNAGVLSGDVVGDELVPRFGHLTLRVLPEPVVTPYGPTLPTIKVQGVETVDEIVDVPIRTTTERNPELIRADPEARTGGYSIPGGQIPAGTVIGAARRVLIADFAGSPERGEDEG